jgi:hypothetical protein
VPGGERRDAAAVLCTAAQTTWFDVGLCLGMWMAAREAGVVMQLLDSLPHC